MDIVGQLFRAVQRPAFDSIATLVTPHAENRSARSCRSDVNVPNIPYRDVRQAGFTAAMCTWSLLSDGEIWNLVNGSFWRAQSGRSAEPITRTIPSDERST